jgi:hypothetical protein
MMPRLATANEKVRVSLDLSVPFFRRLEKLEKVTHESKAGIVRQAIQLYEYVVSRTMEGYSFKAIDQQGKEEGLVFFLPYASAIRQDETEEHREEALLSR